jgi:hypothetical protein
VTLLAFFLWSAFSRSPCYRASPVLLSYAAIALALSSGAALTPAPSLRDVLARAGQYAVDYGDALSTVIADEIYVQRLVRPNGEVREQRTLRSEIAFVHLANTSEWQAFRDVLAVDGKALDRPSGSLERLLRDAPQSALAQARLIATESARYNLGPLTRDFNVPTTAVQFVHPSHRSRFRFDKVRQEALGGVPVWVVGFRERSRGTLIRTTDGHDVPVRGDLWIDPGSGRILRSRFIAENFLSRTQTGPKARGHALLEATWRPDERLGLWVPGEMHERYERWRDDRGQPYDIEGSATYSNYRRFTVDVRIRDDERSRSEAEQLPVHRPDHDAP